MASDNYRNNTRRTSVKNYRGCPSDRRKIKNDGTAHFKERQPFPQPENGSSEKKQFNTDTIPRSSERVPHGNSLLGSNWSSFQKSSRGNFRDSFHPHPIVHPRTNQLYGQSNEHKFRHQDHFPSSHKNISHYNKARDFKKPNLEHSKFNLGERQVKGKSDFDRQEEGTSHRLTNQTVQMHDQEETVEPIKPPQPKGSVLLHHSENVSYEQGPRVQRDPVWYEPCWRPESYEEYINRPDHKIGTGLFLNEAEHLPPRFKMKYEELLQGVERKAIELARKYGEKYVDLEPAVSSLNNHVAAADCDVLHGNKQNSVECVQRYQHSKVFENLGTAKNRTPEGHENVHSKKSGGSENHFRYTTEHSHPTKGTDDKSHENKIPNFEFQEKRDSFPRNVAKYDSNYDDRKSSHKMTTSCGKQITKMNSSPAFQHCEQQLSSPPDVSNRGCQNNRVKQTPAKFRQPDFHTGRYNEASHPQRKSGSGENGYCEGTVRASRIENQEHPKFKTYNHDHLRKNSASSVSVQSGFGTPLNSQGRYSSQYDNCADSKRGSVKQNSEVDSKINQSKAQNPAVERRCGGQISMCGRQGTSNENVTEGKDVAQENVSKCVNEYDKDKTCVVATAFEKRTNKINVTPPFKTCEQPPSSSATSHNRVHQNNQTKQTSAVSEQQTNHSKQCTKALSPQKMPVNKVKTSGEENVRPHQEENLKYCDFKSTYDHARKEVTPSSYVQLDIGMQQKPMKNSVSLSQNSCRRRFDSCTNKRGSVEQGSENSGQNGTKINEHNSQNSPAKKSVECSSFRNKDQRNLLKVKVSRDVHNLDYWRTFLEMAVPRLKFEVSVDSDVAQMLSIAFSNEREARQASASLKNVRRKNTGSPYIKAVKSLRYFENIVNKNLKILGGCLRDINRLYGRVMASHEKIITTTEEELESVKGSGDQGSISTVQERLKEYEEMRDVFFRYTEGKKKSMEAEVEKQETDTVIVSHNLLQMKKDFIREYNCLKGGLPIYAKKEVILDTVLQNQVSVIVAETGSGKSTQLVQYLLQNRFDKDGIIVCTQPRKIAAVSIAKYISGQIGSAVGVTVGYEVGLDKKISRNTKIVYMTDHVLLKKCVNNNDLKGISCVVVDEAHERSLFTDLLLGIIKKCLPNRPDIRVIITSATIDPGVFQDYFSLPSEAIRTVPGRTYPVQIKWQKTDAYVGWNYLEACIKLAGEVHEQNGVGDILVFLTSPQETEDAVNLFKQILPHYKCKIFPMLFSLHGKQDMDEQMKIFSPTPKGCRKIIFATNAAETSITVPGIKFVIDSGMVKEKQYIAEKNRNALVVGFISKSSAEQRKGRAGRTQAGVCYRMYSEKNFSRDMSERVIPEIQRINLQLALLRIMEFKIQPEDFDFVETPPKESIASALHSLEFLGAVKNSCFTDLGKQITRLPLEPQLAKLVILGAEEHVGYEASIIASIASVSGIVFYRTEDNRVTADKKKVEFCKEEGDFLTFLNVFEQWYHTPQERRPQWCTENCINAKAMKIAYHMTEELVQILKFELRIRVHKIFKPPDVFASKCERILFECFSENVCVFSGHKKTGYLSPFEPGSFFLHPSSSLCYLDSKVHNFVVFSSVLKTSRVFLLNITPIQESTIISAYQKGVFPYQIDILKQLQILPARIYPVGESVLIREILGRQGSKLREIEQQIRAFTKTDDFYIDVNVEKGEILIYIEQQYHGIVSKLLNTVIQEAQCHMAKEEDIFRIAECASSCFAVSSGGIVNDILLPGEFREVIVEGYQKQPSTDEVISKLKSFGALQSFQEKEEHGSSQIFATYIKATDAQKAVERLQKLKLFGISGKVSYAKLSDKSLPLFRLQVTWPRFPCLGSGWISFQTVTDCIEASGLLTNKSFYIGDHYILFTPAKASEKELEMKNLPSFVEPGDVTSALKNHLPDYLKVKNVNLVRAKPHRASEVEMNSIKKQLSQMFSQYTPSSKLVVDLKNPNAFDVTWTALVYFENFENGEQALAALRDKAKIDEHKLHIRPVLKSSILCNMQVFKMVEKNLHVLMVYSKNANVCTEFDIKPAAARNNVLITFSCGDIRDLNKVRQEIQKLILGTTLVCSDQAMYSKLFSKSGEEYLKNIEQSTQTVISANALRRTVTIFGPQKAVSSAKSLISCYISTTNTEQVKVFNLSGKKIPHGFLKALRQKFGFRLFGLIEKFTLRAADVDFVNRKLTVKCSEKTMQQVEQCLADLCREVKKSSAKNQSSDQESCPVCMDIITSDLFRLNHCGHAFCRECLLLQMESKIIPLICAKEGCEKPLFVEDINKLLSGNDELRKEFSQAALKNFVSKNSSVRYCPFPDCSMVYRETSQSTEFHCPSCENDICTRCHAFYHHGMTCDMFQRSRVDEDYPLKVWLQEDSENRKVCPKCSSAIEKVDGCNHVLCTQCDTHLCWLCLRTFSCSEDVYHHMPFCDSS